MKKLILISCVCLLNLGGVASAASSSFSPEVESYYANAIAYWGQEPPLCTSVTKVSSPGPISNAGTTVIGLATRPEATPVPCTITVDIDLEPWEICHTVMHEIGHLEGNGHSTDPTNIMYPEITGSQYAPGCPEDPSGPLLERARIVWIHEFNRCRARALYSLYHPVKRCWDREKTARMEYRALLAAQF